jgi:Fur family ferric uptake transcriptional regulator
VTEVPSEMLSGLADVLEREKRFLVDMGHVALFGVCGACGEA